MTTIGASLWTDIMAHVRLNHPDLVRGWFVHLEPGGLSNGVLTVTASNPAQMRYLKQHCARPFAEATQAATGRLVSVAFGSSSTEELEDEYGRTPSFVREDGGLALNSDYVFENFVIGPCNRLAHAAAVAAAESPGRAYNPLFVHGNVGLGKTHLLQAICHGVQERPEQLQALYISCETFINHFIEAVERGALNRFRYRYRHVDALVIDDIQFLAERERSQEEFFHTFNTLHQGQRQIVLSADCSPSEIPSLEERLVSRFNSGLVARIDAPCLETRMAIIRKKAKVRCIEVPEDVVRFIASRVDSNIRELEGALVKIDAMSQMKGGQIDMAVAYEALGKREAPSSITIQDILQAVTAWYNVRLGDIQGRKRHKSIARPRQVCMYLARELTSHSLEEIGAYFGGRDHTTVLHASRLIGTLRADETKLDDALQEITRVLQRRPAGTAHAPGHK
ncbi:MAG: chromosomal replication initiator protein DnaA [Phycisphaerae bacterium]|nr:chromosomal replication initiator protein DnaA [Phycisphaerae bacterium]